MIPSACVVGRAGLIARACPSRRASWALQRDKLPAMLHLHHQARRKRDSPAYGVPTGPSTQALTSLMSPSPSSSPRVSFDRRIPSGGAVAKAFSSLSSRRTVEGGRDCEGGQLGTRRRRERTCHGRAIVSGQRQADGPRGTEGERTKVCSCAVVVAVVGKAR